jgi:signal transduction histidine kinase
MFMGDTAGPSAEPARTVVPAYAGRAWLAGPVTTVLLAAVYVAAAKVAFSIAFVETSIAPIWPPSGIALAAVLLLGYRAVPGIWLGAFVFNASTSVPLWVSAAIATGNALEATAGAWLLRRVGFSHAIDRVRDVLALAGLAVPLSAAISAAVGVGSLWLSATLAADEAPSAWVIWWAGDAAGMLTVAPLLLLASSRRWDHRPRPARVLEAVALAVALVVLTVVGLTVPVARPFVVFPALAWAAVRFRQAGAVVATLFVSAVVVWATARGRGPFAQSSLTHGLLLAQAFTGAMIAGGLLLLAAVTAERDSASRLLDATFERLPLGMVLLNPDLTVRRASRTAQQLLGPQLAAGLSVRTLYRRLQMTDVAGRPWLAEGTEMLAATLRAGFSHGEVVIARHGTGERARLEYWAVPVRDNGGFAALAVLFHDVTLLRRAEADRERLPSRLIRMQENDRRELAGRLRKDVVRGLSAALGQVDRMQEELPATEEQTRRSVRRVVDTLNSSLQATRSLLSDLRPPLLDTQGLVSAISQQLGKIAVETGMHTELHWRREERLDPTLEAIVFRAAQEALTNVVRHARASQLVVTGRSTGGLLTVEIADDGVGFAPDERHRAAVREHLGLRAMAERVELAGGSVDVRSAPNAGTTVSISVPTGAPAAPGAAGQPP